MDPKVTNYNNLKQPIMNPDWVTNLLSCIIAKQKPISSHGTCYKFSLNPFVCVFDSSVKTSNFLRTLNASLL